MSDAPKPTPFNPTWITAVYVVTAGVVAGIVSVSVGMALSQRDSVELRARQEATEARVAVIEKRFSEEQLATGKTLVALAKDVETANKTLASIQQALMVRGTPSYSSNNTP
jgi:hypothetical protein